MNNKEFESVLIKGPVKQEGSSKLVRTIKVVVHLIQTYDQRRAEIDSLLDSLPEDPKK